MSKQPEPRADAEAVLSTDDSGRLTTAARALVLGNALSNGAGLRGIEDDVAAIGFQALPPYWGAWENRRAVVEDSRDVLRELGALDEVEAAENNPQGLVTQGAEVTVRTARLPLWLRVRSNRSAAEAVAWLRLLMTDTEPVAAAAAAVSLGFWQKRQQEEIPAPLAVAPAFAARLARSSDSTAAAIAGVAAGTPSALAVPARNPARASEPTGVMVHGTAAYAGTWWEPGGDFHTFARMHVCKGLYAGGAPFNWSGAYKGRHRVVAAERLAKWGQEVSGGRLCCVYAHSYGGVVAQLATTHGLEVGTLVLLSVPVENVPVEWRNVGRAVSLRIHADLVLLAARRRQRFTENVEEQYLPRWFINHGDSHDPQVWVDEGCATTLRLP